MLHLLYQEHSEKKSPVYVSSLYQRRKIYWWALICCMDDIFQKMLKGFLKYINKVSEYIYLKNRDILIQMA